MEAGTPGPSKGDPRTLITPGPSDSATFAAAALDLALGSIQVMRLTSRWLCQWSAARDLGRRQRGRVSWEIATRSIQKRGTGPCLMGLTVNQGPGQPERCLTTADDTLHTACPPVAGLVQQVAPCLTQPF